MNICKKCNGNASVQVRTEDEDGMIAVAWRLCEACKGSGVNQYEDEEGNSFDEVFDMNMGDDDDEF